jgi:hypothetical protein
MKILFKLILVISVVFLLPKLTNAQSIQWIGTPINIVDARNIFREDSAHEFGQRDTTNHSYRAGTMISFRGQPWWWNGTYWYQLFGDSASDVGQVNSDWNATTGVAQILNKPTLATVAISGSYADLTSKPTIPAAQVNSDWNAISGISQILNEPRVLDSIYRTSGKDSIYFVIRHGTTLTTYRILDSLGTAGGSGVMDSIAVSGLSPLFSTSITNNGTSKPTVTYTLNNFAAYGVLMNNTNANAQPTVVTPTSTILNQWFGDTIQNIIHLTTVGSGAASLTGKILNIPINSGSSTPDTIHLYTYGTGKNLMYTNTAGNLLYNRTVENSSTISFGLNPDSSIYATSLLTPTMSLTNSGVNWTLVNDNASPGASQIYMTNPTGTKGWYAYTNIPVATSTVPGLESSSDYNIVHFQQTIINAGVAYDSLAWASPTLDTLYFNRFNFIPGAGISISKAGSYQGLNQYTITATGTSGAAVIFKNDSSINSASLDTLTRANGDTLNFKSIYYLPGISHHSTNGVIYFGLDTSYVKTLAGWGASGSSYTFTNGLTNNTGTVSLGGALLSNTATTLSGNGTNSFAVTNMTPTSSTGFRVDLTSNASDATGDIFYRTSYGFWNRLPIGTTNGEVLVVNAGLPAWSTSPLAGSQFTPTQSAGNAGTIYSSTYMEFNNVVVVDGMFSITSHSGSTTATLSLPVNVSSAFSGNTSILGQSMVDVAPVSTAASAMYITAGSASTGTIILNFTSPDTNTHYIAYHYSYLKY